MRLLQRSSTATFNSHVSCRSQLRRPVVHCSSSQQQRDGQTSTAAGAPSRRQLLQAALIATISAASAQSALADDFGLESQLPTALPQAPDLPKPYVRTMNRLVKALQESIEAEASGAKELEVRRKADPAKELVKEFVAKWRDSPAVMGDITHDEMKELLGELGQFYMRHGSRSRLSVEVRDSVLRHLEAVQSALPEEPKSLLGL